MRQKALPLAIFITLFLLSNPVQAGNKLSVSYSPTKITHAMDLSVRANSMRHLYTLTSSPIDSVSRGSMRPDTLRLKSPETALLIAVVPGFVFHGSGHFYARKSLTGLALFATEYIGFILYLRGSNFMGGSGGDHDTEQAEYISGIALFFGSWAYDLIGAPLAVNKENERLLGISY